jgi:ABC-type nitrate/sulfonate/bicarbonate transport system ATPase subunit
MMTANSAPSVLSVENLVYGYRDRLILDGFSAQLRRGEVTAIVGPSGCGKTTLLRLIAGMERPQGGSVNIQAHAGQVPIAYMFQDYDAFPWMTVRDNLRLSGTIDEASIAGVLKDLGLQGMERRFPRQLSGGQRKRVALARCLLSSPALLIMDEPFSSLDVRTKVGIFDQIEQTYLGEGRSGLFVTHNIDEAVILSDRILVLTGPPLRIVEDISVGTTRPRGRSFVQTEVFKTAEAQVLSRLLR